MSAVVVEVCPETGICSIVKHGACKVDLMPQEVDALRQAGGDVAAIKKIVSESDAAFAETLDSVEIEAILGKLG